MALFKKDADTSSVPAQREKFKTQRADLVSKLEAAQAKQAELNKTLGTTILNAELDDDEFTRKAVTNATKAFAEANERIKNIGLAITTLDTQIENFEHNLKLKFRSSQFRLASERFRKRNEAAKVVSDHLLKAGQAFADVVTYSEAARFECHDLPTHAFVNKPSLLNLLRGEIYRISGEAGLITMGSLNHEAEALPGSKMLNGLDADPKSVIPFADQLAKAGDDAIAELKRERPMPVLTATLQSSESKTAEQIIEEMRNTPKPDLGPRPANPNGPTRTLAEATAAMSRPKRVSNIDAKGRI